MHPATDNISVFFYCLLSNLEYVSLPLASSLINIGYHLTFVLQLLLLLQSASLTSLLPCNRPSWSYLCLFIPYNVLVFFSFTVFSVYSFYYQVWCSGPLVFPQTRSDSPNKQSLKPVLVLSTSPHFASLTPVALSWSFTLYCIYFADQLLFES